MFADWLDRAGLALDLISGFLITPKMMGQERLELLEQSIEHVLHLLAEDLKEVEEMARAQRKRGYRVPWVPTRMPLVGKYLAMRLGIRRYVGSRFHIIISFLLALIFFIISDAMFVRLFGSNAAYDLLFHRYPVHYTSTDAILYALLAFGCIVFGSIACYVFEYWLLRFSKRLIARLRGEAELRGELLLDLGILCLIVGFLLQLIATFF